MNGCQVMVMGMWGCDIDPPSGVGWGGGHRNHEMFPSLGIGSGSGLLLPPRPLETVVGPAYDHTLCQPTRFARDITCNSKL